MHSRKMGQPLFSPMLQLSKSGTSTLESYFLLPCNTNAQEVTSSRARFAKPTREYEVVSNGYTTGTTIGRLNRFQSKVRIYGPPAPSIPPKPQSCPTAGTNTSAHSPKAGTLGAAVGGPDGKFVSLLTVVLVLGSQSTSPTRPRCIGFGTKSSWSSSQAPTSTSTRTRFVSSSCLMPLYL